MFSPGIGGSTGDSSCSVMSSYEMSPSCSNRSLWSLMCSVTCSWAASSLYGCTWDRAHLTTEPRYAIQTVANVLLMTTPGCQKSVSKTRGVVQRAVRPCGDSLCGTGLVSIDVCGPRLDLPVGQGVSYSSTVPVPLLPSAVGSPRQGLLLTTLQNGIFHLCRILAENTLIRTVSAVVDF